MTIPKKVSKTGLGLLLTTLGLAIAQSTACSKPFRTCYETRTCPPKGSDDAGAGGDLSDGTGGVGDSLTEGGGAGRSVEGHNGGDGPNAPSAGAAGGSAEGGSAGSAECTENQFEDAGRCHNLTVCTAGTSVSVAPTAGTDRQCSPCPANTFSSTLNAATCGAWSACKSGESESVAPSATSDRVCSVCGNGKYERNGQCLALTTCQSAEYEATAATAASDRKCAAVTVCQPGNQQTAAPTTTTDRQCGPCGAGTFSTTSNAATCTAWKTCSSNQTLTKAGTSTSDAQCTDKPICGAAADRTCTIDCPCASGEGVCTANNQCVSGASCVVGGGKKMGRTGNTCLVAHCDNDKKDADETSVDCGGSCGCRATFEVVSFKNPASGSVATNDTLVSMSGDGSRFAGTLSRGGTAYPAAIGADGTVTELPSNGAYGYGWAISADGNVIIGETGCANPPACTDHTTTEVKWVGNAAPQTIINNGFVRYVSGSGTYVGGSFYNATLSTNVGFIINGNALNEVDELRGVGGMSKDGKYLVGDIPDDQGGGIGLFYSPTRTITKISNANWSSGTSVLALNGNTPVLIGVGYPTASSVAVGYRWKGGVFTELGVLSPTNESRPSAISNDGNTVIGTTYPFEVAQAFIWTETDKLRYLVDELRNRGYEPPGDMLLKYPRFISEDGKTIVGVEILDPPTFWRVVLN